MDGDLEERHIVAFLSGDPNALDDAALTALTEFAMSVIRFRFGRKIREADLEPLALDAIESAWESRRTFRGRAAFTTWLSRIIVRKTSTYHKNRLREAQNQVSLESGEGNDEDGWRELQVASRDNPAETVRMRILWEYAETVLSKRQAQAFHMWMDGYSEREIGEALAASSDDPENAAKQLLKQVRIKLRRIFDMTADTEIETKAAGPSAVGTSKTDQQKK